MTHICINDLDIIGANEADRRQAIKRTNSRILLIWPLRTNFRTHFNEILIKIYPFWLKKVYLNMSPAKWRQFRLGLDMLMFFFFDSLIKLIMLMAI